MKLVCVTSMWILLAYAEPVPESQPMDLQLSSGFNWLGRPLPLAPYLSPYSHLIRPYYPHDFTYSASRGSPFTDLHGVPFGSLAAPQSIRPSPSFGIYQWIPDSFNLKPAGMKGSPAIKPAPSDTKVPELGSSWQGQQPCLNHLGFSGFPFNPSFAYAYSIPIKDKN